MTLSGATYREAQALNAAVVPLPDVSLGTVGPVKKRLLSRHGSVGALHRGDFARYAWLLRRVVGESLLDVGCSHGVFLDAAAALWPEMRLGGLDRKMGKMAVATAWTPYVADARSLPFGDASWDTVSAQEVLEHQTDVASMLAELRRVTAKRLLVTVPLCQPKLSGGHVQRFCAERLRELFPTARFTVLDKRNGSYPWVLVEEER